MRARWPSALIYRNCVSQRLPRNNAGKSLKIKYFKDLACPEFNNNERKIGVKATCANIGMNYKKAEEPNQTSCQ